MLKKKNSEQQESSYPWKLEFADSKFNSAYEVLTSGSCLISMAFWWAINNSGHLRLAARDIC